MPFLISILTIIAAVLMILVVLVQNSKGGGLDTTFGNANQLGGAAQSTETIEKATWTLAAGIAALSIIAAMFVGTPTNVDTETQIKGKGPSGVPTTTAPVSAPSNLPAAPGQ